MLLFFATKEKKSRNELTYNYGDGPHEWRESIYRIVKQTQTEIHKVEVSGDEVDGDESGNKVGKGEDIN